MKYTRLGQTGLTVSRLCLGCMSYGAKSWRDWVLEEAESHIFFRRAFDAGINFYDTADVYSLGRSEEILGQAVKEFSGGRDKVVIATKVYNPMSDDPNDRGLSRKHIMASIDRSLMRLGTDYVDLYQIHRFDPKTPIEETIDALDATVRAGKVRYLGASSMYAWQFANMVHQQKSRRLASFVTMQNHYNLVYREEEREMIPYCVDQGIGLLPWSPLARGFLAGSRKRDGKGDTTRARSDDFADKMYFADEDFDVADAVQTVAKAHGVPPAQIALAWLLKQPQVTAPIIGATKIGHLEDALAALSIDLSDENVKALEAHYRPHRILGHE